MKLTDEELDFLAGTYANNRYRVEPQHTKPSVTSRLARKLLEYGLVTEERNTVPHTHSVSYWLVRPSLKGIQFVRAYHPTDMVRAFVRADCLDCAVFWIYNWVRSLGELPELLAHKDPDIRTAARVRFESLTRGGKVDGS